MALDLPPEPVRNTPITAEWGRKVARALRALQPIPGPGLAIDLTANGTTFRLAAERSAGPEATLVLRAWQPRLLPGAADSAGKPTRRLVMRVGAIAYLNAEGETTCPTLEAGTLGELNDGRFELPAESLASGVLYLCREGSAEATRWCLELGAEDLPLAEVDAAGLLRFRRKAIAVIDLTLGSLVSLIPGSRIEVADPASASSAGEPGKDGQDGADGKDGITWTPKIVESAGGSSSDRPAGTYLDWLSNEPIPQEIQGTVNIKGPQGEQGPKGDPGEAADLGEAQTITVVTGVQYDTSTHKLTLTRRAISFYGTSTGTESTVDITEATAHSAEHEE